MLSLTGSCIISLQVGGSRDIAARDEVHEKSLTLGSIACKLLDSDDRNTCNGDGMISDARKQKPVKKHDNKRRKERGSSYLPPTSGGKTTPEVKQGLKALKHLSIKELESEMHQTFSWNENDKQVEEMEYHYDNVSSMCMDVVVVVMLFLFSLMNVILAATHSPPQLIQPSCRLIITKIIMHRRRRNVNMRVKK